MPAELEAEAVCYVIPVALTAAETNITPTSAASGIRSIKGDRNNTNSKIITDRKSVV